MDIQYQYLNYISQDTIKRLAKIGTGVEFIDSKLYKCKFYTVTKFKTYLHSKGHPANTIREKDFFNFIFPIIFMGYNGLKGYTS